MKQAITAKQKKRKGFKTLQCHIDPLVYYNLKILCAHYRQTLGNLCEQALGEYVKREVGALAKKKDPTIKVWNPTEVLIDRANAELDKHGAIKTGEGNEVGETRN